MRVTWRRVLSVAGLVLLIAAAHPGARQLASRPAPDWIQRLERPERVAGLKVDEIIKNLNLKPGDVVADIGAGAGVFSVPMAKVVSPRGKVYAVEIDQGFLDHIDGKVKAQNVTNVVTVLGEFADPKLPAKDVDLALFHDVLHHVKARAEYLKNLAPYIKKTGRIAVVELDAVKGGHKDEPELQVTKEQLQTWMADAGFKPAQEFKLFEDKWYVIYERK